MVLQGVIILRISDLIRFFDLAEFWQFKEGFCKLLKSDEHGCFFDTKEQKYLANEVMEWLQDREPRVTVNNDCLVISVDGNDCRLPLGRLAAPARDCWNKHSLTEKQLKGVTALYLMLGADKTDSDIPIQYDFFSSMQSGAGDLMPLFTDCVLQASSRYSSNSYNRSVIVNMNTQQSGKKTRVQCGVVDDVLNPMDCISGLFDSDNKCTRLFSRSIRDYEGLTCSLAFNPSTKKPRLKVERSTGVSYIDNVCCFYIERGGYLVYLTLDGELHYNANKCFKLNCFYSMFRKNRPNSVLLAFEVSHSGDYTFYTDQGIIR